MINRVISNAPTFSKNFPPNCANYVPAEHFVASCIIMKQQALMDKCYTQAPGNIGTSTASLQHLYSFVNSCYTIYTHVPAEQIVGSCNIMKQQASLRDASCPWPGITHQNRDRLKCRKLSSHCQEMNTVDFRNISSCRLTGSYWQHC